MDVLCDLKELDCGYAQETVLHDIKLSVFAGDRIGLLGRNGQGKSTLIKTICGVIPPIKGSFALGKGVKIGYFAQHELESLRPQLSALDHLRLIDPDATEKDLRSFLGSFAFSGDKATNTVISMSGGEQARLALAILAYQKPNLLLLDEPTNHLDLDMREALSVGLASYSGALILVSHDRYLLEAIASKLWLVDNGKVIEFDGDLNDYQDYLNLQNKEYKEKLRAQKHDLASNQAKAQNYKSREQKKADAAFRASLRPLKLEVERLEKQMEQCKKRLNEIDEALADSNLYNNDKDKVESLLKERAKFSSDNDELEMQWLEKQEEIENKTQEYQKGLE